MHPVLLPSVRFLVAGMPVRPQVRQRAKYRCSWGAYRMISQFPTRSPFRYFLGADATIFARVASVTGGPDLPFRFAVRRA
jgi:hypothetical protein